MDKVEPPVIPEGFGVSLAFCILLAVVKSVRILIEGDIDESHEAAKQAQIDSRSLPNLSEGKMNVLF